MLVPIQINTGDLYSQFDISKDEVESIIDTVVKDITASFYNKWRQEASSNLEGTRKRYLNNLSMLNEGRMSGAVVLDYSKDPLIRMLEEGANAFDEKEGFSKSDKKKSKNDGGWYLTIPFSIGTPGSIGDDLNFSSTMPSEIYSIAKKLDAGKSISKSDIDAKYSIPQTRAAFSSIPESKTFQEYKHKAGIFEGITKIQDSTTGQNSYMTFRRVSDKSNTDSWIHPGLDRRDFAEKALEKLRSSIDIEVQRSIDNSLNFLGF